MNKTQYNVKIHGLFDKGNMRGIASANIDGKFVIKGIRIIEGYTGMVLSMPGYQDKRGQFHDCCYALTKEVREDLKQAVMLAYNLAIAQRIVDSGKQVHPGRTDRLSVTM